MRARVRQTARIGWTAEAEEVRAMARVRVRCLDSGAGSG